MNDNIEIRMLSLSIDFKKGNKNLTNILPKIIRLFAKNNKYCELKVLPKRNITIINPEENISKFNIYPDSISVCFNNDKIDSSIKFILDKVHKIFEVLNIDTYFWVSIHYQYIIKEDQFIDKIKEILFTNSFSNFSLKLTSFTTKIDISNSVRFFTYHEELENAKKRETILKEKYVFDLGFKHKSKEKKNIKSFTENVTYLIDHTILSNKLENKLKENLLSDLKYNIINVI